jgi:hypothetical protein
VRSFEDGLGRFLYLQFQNRIAAAINELPEQERLVMTLYYYEELGSLSDRDRDGRVLRPRFPNLCLRSFESSLPA